MTKYKYKILIQTVNPVKFVQLLTEFGSIGATFDSNTFPRLRIPYTASLRVETDKVIEDAPEYKVIKEVEFLSVKELEKLNWVEYGEYMKSLNIKVTNKRETYARYFDVANFKGKEFDDFLVELEAAAAAKDATKVVSPKASSKKVKKAKE